MRDDLPKTSTTFQQISAGRAAEMLGTSRAEFYEIFSQRKIPLPIRLNESILKELSALKEPAAL